MISKSNNVSVTISEEELLALHQTLLEAKFHAEPDNSDVAGSPIVAGIANRVYDALVRLEEVRGNASKSEQWTKWRQVENKKWIVERVRDYAIKNPHWEKWDNSVRIDYLRCAISPFEIGEDRLHSLLDEINAAAS